jgi:phospholipid/cholesterol/gamma-HCH transport system substrate-binding protein
VKFKIRFADQIVGIFIIVAFAAIIFVIFMLGSKQRWFIKDPTYKTYLQSASGLAENMPIQYKGFTIGNVKSFKLNEDDEVETILSIYNEYYNRVKEGSLVRLNASPIGLGNTFLFYPGLGEDLVAEGGYIPTVTSAQGQTLIQLGLATVPQETDSISNILSQVDTVTKELNVILTDLGDAFKGTDTTSLGRTIGGLETTIVGLNTIPGSVDNTLTSVNELLVSLQAQITNLLANVQPILTDVNSLTGKLNEPDGLLYSVLDTNGPVYSDIVKALDSVTGILKDIDDTTDVLPAQVPPILMQVRSTLKMVDDILIALENNPLLKKGVPVQIQIQSSGTNPRDVEF